MIANTVSPQIDRLRILHGDCVERMRTLDAGSVQLVVTSPPYDDLRTYGGHSWDFEATARELFRVLCDGGVVCWIVANKVSGWGESLTAERQRIYFQSLGFAVRKMIYHKLNFANPNATCYHRLHEDITLCCKGTKPRVFNPIKDIPTVWKKALGRNTLRMANGSMRDQKQGVYGDFAKRSDVWIGPTSGQENPCKSIEHPATMPLWLARDLVLSWSDPDDTVLDPFGGSGTTALAAIEQGRSALMIELNADYCALIERRCDVTLGLPLTSVPDAQPALTSASGVSSQKPALCSPTVTLRDKKEKF